MSTLESANTLWPENVGSAMEAILDLVVQYESGLRIRAQRQLLRGESEAQLAEGLLTSIREVVVDYIKTLPTEVKTVQETQRANDVGRKQYRPRESGGGFGVSDPVDYSPGGSGSGPFSGEADTWVLETEEHGGGPDGPGLPGGNSGG